MVEVGHDASEAIVLLPQQVADGHLGVNHSARAENHRLAGHQGGTSKEKPALSLKTLGMHNNEYSSSYTSRITSRSKLFMGEIEEVAAVM